jgi:multiple sugar transport system substrate-binding protein
LSAPFGNPPGFYAFFLYLWQSGGEFLSADESKPAFNSPEGLRALEWMVKQVAKVGGAAAVQPLTMGFEAGPGRDIFSVGRLGMQYHTSAVKQTYEQGVPDLRFGIGPLPIPANGRPMNYAGGFALAIPKAARQPDGAWRLAEFLVTKEAQLPWSRTVSTIPVLKAVATSAEYQQGDAARKVFVDELQRGAKWVPTIPGTVDVLDAFGKQFTAAINGQIAPADALNAAAAQVQVVLDQNKQYR